jgi:hypothetical protein
VRKEGKREVYLIFILFSCFLLPLPCNARRIKDQRYPLERYYISGTKLGKPVIDSRYSFPFPVGLSHHHVSCYLWVKDMVTKRRLPQGLPLIYLDAHHDFLKSKTLQNSNWVRFVLEERLCSKALWVLPGWLGERKQIFDKEIQRLSTPTLPVSVVKNLEQLPNGDELGPVILSIDCDYFSSIDPFHQAKREEVQKEIERIVKTLERKGIEIAALNIAISPGYTSLGLEAFIKEELLEAFSQYGGD